MKENTFSFYIFLTNAKGEMHIPMTEIMNAGLSRKLLFSPPLYQMLVAIFKMFSFSKTNKTMPKSDDYYNCQNFQ